MGRLTLALIAHDSKKEDLVSLLRAHLSELTEIDLIAPKDTGQFIQMKTGLSVTLLEIGAYGGEAIKDFFFCLGMLLADSQLTKVFPINLFSLRILESGWKK